MHDSSLLPGLLPDSVRSQVETILDHCDILLLTSYFWRTEMVGGIVPRRLADSLLYVQVRGRARFRVGTDWFVVEPGQFLMIAEGIDHEACLAEGCDHIDAYVLHTHAYTTHSRPLFQLFCSPLGYLPGAESWFQQLALLTHLMGKDENLGRPLGSSIIRGMLLLQLQQGNPLQETPSACDPRIWLAVSAILKEFDRPLTVEDLAKRANLGTAQFRKLFKRHIGTPPKAYIQQTRLRKARALLQTNPAITVKEVAEQTGFCDAHYLHAVFKATYGQTPATVRQGQK